MSKSEWVATKTDKAERLLQITCALLFASRGLTKEELYSAIPAYAADFVYGDKNESLNRMFERDKTDLRKAGIQVMTANPLAGPDEMKYIIAEDTFVWPKQVSLSGRQLQLLKLASQVWSRASMQDDASQGLIRLRALGVEPATSDLIGYAPRINTHEPSFDALNRAIENCYRVTFDYRKASGEVAKRNVEPWSLHNIDGQWLLQCFDLKKQAPRNFLLRRIISEVKPVTLEDEIVIFDKPDDARLKAAEQDLWDLIADQTAEITVAKDSPAWFHFHLDDSVDANPGEITLHYMDLHLLAEELREFIFDVKIARPKELAEILRESFERIASDHA